MRIKKLNIYRTNIALCAKDSLHSASNRDFCNRIFKNSYCNSKRSNYGGNRNKRNNLYSAFVCLDLF